MLREEKLMRTGEIRIGRVNGLTKSGPRVIDLDIIIWDGVIVHKDYPGKSYVSTPIDELLETRTPTAPRS
jgi:2-amino-4-hydroxy-6-hydroxymethyldihydropteridine diphosphokinase